ncbi:unnamed protein product [Pleuronectes platessa]|uniref:Uncharacterized protein n=1 Tax=Pleuronectes platessa TaxID=8262 RepID=A0A9N7YA17_PLEPL|nr:unnamed protein product [Pleuronectes platessa]
MRPEMRSLSVAPAVADTSVMCLNLKCMTILPKASDPEGQRDYLTVKTRTSSPVSVAPKKRTFSPWCVSPYPPATRLYLPCCFEWNARVCTPSVSVHTNLTPSPLTSPSIH